MSRVLRWFLLGALSLGATTPGRSLELNGQSYFTQPPWRVEFTKYDWLVDQGGPEYFFTVSLAQNAGADLGGLVITQTSGSDQTFWIDPTQTTAFFGRPRQEGTAIPVRAQFHEQKRIMRVEFPEPPPAGSTLTVVLRPPNNPSLNDLYLFAVEALPAGPNPAAASLGFARMEILDDWGR
ncbi:DUF2808 domain-containing protein [Synechococcus sp. CB0205]|uniref:DUF2808 domain-containing protein n=1 Tax=Synechococcus sp. CB0205 TaxID=232363 RepID=UPI00020022B5|nr:DUF2808 domain-containing protein [Synechococcus sp. CB0205]